MPKPRNSRETNFKAHQGSNLFYLANKIRDTEDATSAAIALVHESNIVGSCTAVPADLSQEKEPHAFLFIKPRMLWPGILKKCMVEDLQEKDIH